MPGGETEAAGGHCLRLLDDLPEGAEHAALAHQQVGVENTGRFVLLAQRGDAAADERPRRVRRSEEGGLVLGDRPLGREAGEHLGGSAERFSGAEREVERPVRRLHDPRPPQRVAEIEEREILRPGFLRVGGGEEQVVVVRVVVERPGGQGQKIREAGEEAIRHPEIEVCPFAAALPENRRSRPDDRLGVSRRPGDLLPVEPRMIEVRERPLQPTEQPAGGCEQRLRPPGHRGEGPPLEIGKQPNQVGRPAEPGGGPMLPGPGRRRPRQPDPGSPRLHLLHQRLVHIEPLRRFAGGADLQDETPPLGGLEEEVPVPFAGERCGAPGDPPVLPGEVLRLRRRHRRPPRDGVREGDLRAGPSAFPRHQRSRRRIRPSLPA